MSKDRKTVKQKQLKEKPDLTNDHFMANGNKYIIKKSLSIERYRAFEKLEYIAGYGVTFEQMFERLKSLREKLNKQLFYDCSVDIYNTLEGIQDRINREYPPLLRIASLFIIREGDDDRTWSEQEANERIKDWMEDYYPDFFLQLAVNLARGFLPILKEPSQSISNHQEKIIKKVRN